jgi:hypothetical protein
MGLRMTKIAVLVCGVLEPPSARTSGDLEQAVIQIMGVLEGDASGIAIGPVVACDFQASSIDVRFSVEADSSAEVHGRISRITQLIDEAVGGRVRTSMAPADQLELACA